MYSYGPPHMAEKKQDDQLEHTYYVKIRNVALKTSRRRWTIGRSGKRGSGISMLAARHDDDEVIYISFTLYRLMFASLLFMSLDVEEIFLLAGFAKSLGSFITLLCVMYEPLSFGKAGRQYTVTHICIGYMLFSVITLDYVHHFAWYLVSNIS